MYTCSLIYMTIFKKVRLHRRNLPRGVYSLELVLLVGVLKGRADCEGQEGGVARRTDGEDGLRLAVDVPVRRTLYDTFASPEVFSRPVDRKALSTVHTKIKSCSCFFIPCAIARL